MNRSVVIHAHCYQPPREEPWLELVPREPSAAPDHDWNVRITRECYRQLGHRPLRNQAGQIRGAINCYEWLSFDIGPTLVHWLELHAPDVMEAMADGDRASAIRTGHGNAIAAPYHHVILPLASKRDRVTEIRWGMQEFRRIFGRDPEGIWLPETAVDEETLEIAADEGIRFTILAPHQVEPVPADGRPVIWRGTGGREMVLCPYDGLLAHEVAFGSLAGDPARFAERLAGSPDDPRSVISLATDGETFGHHHRTAADGLAGALDLLIAANGPELTNFAAICAGNRPFEEARLNARTSWSCVHGLGRWLEECGCRMDPATSQQWRTPLRRGLENLAEGIREVAAREWPAEAGRLEEVRDAAGPQLDGVSGLPLRARRLLEAQRHSMAMFTSCAWFFDDLGRIEPRIVLRHAARALEFLPREDAESLEGGLLDTLSLARSNDPAKGSGVDIWQRDVMAEAAGPARLAAAIAALRELAPDLLDSVAIPTHEWRVEDDVVVTTHRRTGVVYRWQTDPVVLGVVAARVHVRMLGGAGTAHLMTIAQYPAPFRLRLLELATPLVVRELSADRPARTPALLMAAAADRAADIAATGRFDAACTLLHAATDLLELDESIPEESLLARLWLMLADFPASPNRRRLAERLNLVMP